MEKKSTNKNPTNKKKLPKKIPEKSPNIPPKKPPKLYQKTFRRPPKFLQKSPPNSSKNPKKSYLKKYRIPKNLVKIPICFPIKYCIQIHRMFLIRKIVTRNLDPGVPRFFLSYSFVFLGVPFENLEKSRPSANSGVFLSNAWSVLFHRIVLDFSDLFRIWIVVLNCSC